MPQMSPLDWFLLMNYFLLMYMLLMLMIYFLMNLKLNKMNYLIKKLKFYIKWY